MDIKDILDMDAETLVEQFEREVGIIIMNKGECDTRVYKQLKLELVNRLYRLQDLMR